MDTRVFWLKNEYGVFSAGGYRQLSPEEASRRLLGPVASGGLAAGVLLRNGGRLHVETASRLGYATPECGNVPDLVVHDKAGDRILEGLLADARQRPGEKGDEGDQADEGKQRDISVLKTSADPSGHRYGCQEDYLVARRGEFGRLADILIPFLVTRQLICGAGTVAQTTRGAAFCLGRTAGPAVNAKKATRPLIKTRDEPRTTPGFRRLCVTVSDPAMSETTTLLKAGATDLVLRMAEAGTVPPSLRLTLDNPVRAIGEVSQDITGRALVRLADGRQMSALDIQREYLATAKVLTDQRGADAVSRRVLGLWERALDAIGSGNLDAVAREIDWVIKYRLIERYRAEHGVPMSAPEVAQADLAYHDISRDRGLYYELQRGGAVERTARDIDIFEAKTVPPTLGRYRQAG